MNKDLKKLAKILRSLDVYAKIEEKGTENEFLCVREKKVVQIMNGKFGTMMPIMSCIYSLITN